MIFLKKLHLFIGKVQPKYMLSIPSFGLTFLWHLQMDNYFSI